MSLRRFNPCFGFSRRIGAISVSCFLFVLALALTVLCFSQLRAESKLPNGIQGAFAIAGILQVVLVASTPTIIFASWKEHTRLLCFSAYLTPILLILNSIVLVCLLVVVAPIESCRNGLPPQCLKLVAPKPALSVLSVLIFATQLYLSLVVFSYYLHSEDNTRRPYATPRKVSAAPSHGSDHKRLLSNSEPYHNADMDAVEFGTITHSNLVSEPEAGYGGGMRTYEEAEGNEKDRLRREMENEGSRSGSFPIPSMPETGILTPLGREWRDGDLPPYTS